MSDSATAGLSDAPDPGTRPVTDNVNAILGRMDRDRLPPQLQPGYQPPVPTALSSVAPWPGKPFGGWGNTPAPPAPPAPQPAATPATQPPVTPSPPNYNNIPAPTPQQVPGGTGTGIFTPAPRQQPGVLGGNQPMATPAPVNVQPVSGTQIDQTLVRDPSGRNNPGNLRTLQGPFQTFSTMSEGLQAMQNQLLRYQDVYHLNTIEKIITRYSPPNENPTERLIQEAAARMNIPRNQPIDLHDPTTLMKLTNAILAQEESGSGSGGKGDPQRATPQPTQQPMQPISRGYTEWGTPPPGMGMNIPGAMPQQQNFLGIVDKFLPLLMAVGSLALRLPLSTAIRAYGAMAQSQRGGSVEQQKLDYEINSHRARTARDEASAQQEMESKDASDAFATYANNPQGLQQALIGLALKYNDPAMLQAAERGDFQAIHDLQSKRDEYNQPLMKLREAEQKMQLEQQKFQLDEQIKMLELQMRQESNDLQRAKLRQEIDKAKEQRDQINQERQSQGLPPLPNEPDEEPSAPASSAPGGSAQPPAQTGQPAAPAAPAAPQPTQQAGDQPATAQPPAQAQPLTLAPTETEGILGAPQPAPGITAGIPGWNRLTPQQQSLAAMYGERLAGGENPDWKGIPEGLQSYAQQYAAQATNELQRLNNSGLSGDALMQRMEQVDPYRAGMIRAMIDGRYPEPTGFSARSPFWQGAIGVANKIDPTLDATTFGTRASTYRDFTSGADGRNLTAIGTAYRHMNELERTIKDKAGTHVALLNAPFNALVGAFGQGGAARSLQEFLTAREAASDELTRAFRGTGGAQANIEFWHDLFSPSKTANQLNAALVEARRLLQGRMEEVGARFSAGSGRPVADMPRLFERYTKDGGTAQRLNDVINWKPPVPGEAAHPPVPSGLAPDSQWSPSRQQWRDPSGKLYDAQGRPAGG